MCIRVIEYQCRGWLVPSSQASGELWQYLHSSRQSRLRCSRSRSWRTTVWLWFAKKRNAVRKMFVVSTYLGTDERAEVQLATRDHPHINDGRSMRLPFLLPWPCSGVVNYIRDSALHIQCTCSFQTGIDIIKSWFIRLSTRISVFVSPSTFARRSSWISRPRSTHASWFWVDNSWCPYCHDHSYA
jgi:hypothetical protein